MLTGDGFAATFPGEDTLDGGPGADVVSGDQGVGTADYSRRTTGVEVRLDGPADDGGVEDAGGDSVDAENVTATAGDDVLVGDDAANLLRGDQPAGGDHLSKARAERAPWGARAPTSCWAATQTTRWTSATGRPTRSAAMLATPTPPLPTASMP
jgi:hypothetical protein